MIKHIASVLPVAAFLVGTVATADDLYFGLADGNTDLSVGNLMAQRGTEGRIGVQPGVGGGPD